MRLEVVNPEDLGAPRGFSHGILAPSGGRLLFVAGQTARDADGPVEGDFVAQFAHALDNVLAVVQAAGGAPESLARLTIYITDRASYLASLESLGVAYRARMGSHYPAMALVEVAALVDPRAVVEIEATAVLPPESGK